MPKSIYLTDEQWSQVAAHAVACGFFVGRGPKSELAKFVVLAASKAHNNGCTKTSLSAGADSAQNQQSAGANDVPENNPAGL